MKTRFTLAQHQAVGGELHQMRDRLLTLSIEVDHAYPRNHPFPRALTRALDALDAARSAGDDAHAADQPDEFTPTTYYPMGSLT